MTQPSFLDLIGSGPDGWQPVVVAFFVAADF